MGEEKKDVTRILIVDDVETNRFTLRDIIADMGFQPILTENGEQALKIVERFPLQLIISDIAMPVMDGYELCKRVKANPETRDIPIIFISAFDDPAEIVKGFELKGEDYIVKPFIPEVVKARVQVHIQVAENKKIMQEMNRKLSASVNEQLKRMEVEKQNALYVLLRMIKEYPSYDEDVMKRLSDNCKTLSEALQLTNEYGNQISDGYINTIELASQLCYLGQVGNSREELDRIRDRKWTDLSDEEKEFKKIHTVVGANILQDVYEHSLKNDFILMSLHIAKSHHENWDGSGFPEGLKENEIPLSAQIVHILRDYDELVRKGSDFDTAIQQMEPDAGVVYNPVIFNVLKKIGRQIR